MALHNEIGKQGEELAAKYIVDKGYEVLETNWRFKKSEIDIIAKKENNVVFIEVKTLTSTYFQEPEQSVKLKKQKQIFIGANEYSQSFAEEFNVRFDIITVIIKKTADIKHIKDAFYPIA
jgi:putative endonuclease